MGLLLVIVGLVIIGVVAYLWITSYKKDTGDIDQRAKELDLDYSPDMNRFAARKETKAAKARTELTNQLVEESNAVIALYSEEKGVQTARFDQAHHHERLQLNYDIEKASFQTILEQNKATTEQNKLTQQLIGKAASEQMDLATYLELKKKIEMDRLELDKQWQEAQNELKAGFIYQLQAHQHLALMTEYIGSLYTRAKKLQEEGKDREHALIEEHIAFMEGDFRERQRLLQTNQQEDLQGSDEDTDSTGDGPEAVQTTQE